ncbi:PPOX class F420-dependent oxidoreductase [Geodermatophilus sp. DSM 45219]|uniref:PPOX class F420-dependent oxidoreductase n=1 Tax=Geodermatophilus sp. DSM 45219 TaxID=1881103 RepID=UPI000885BAF2|nr:PPOX class F420-dependent oxidoreductase [Geodermatophilus sp. DSM 45219]SDN52686.1 PPOX class probable F420-dependent enzyme [Geodermatophilus sp. DSM 45219]
MATTENALLGLLRPTGRGVLATIKADGRPQLSTVDYTYEERAGVLRFSTTQSRAKVANLRRDPRASFYVATPDGGSYSVLECKTELTDPAEQPHDAVADELVDVYRAVQGEHPDWDEYRAVMVADRRLVVRLHIERSYGWIRG